MSFHDSCNKAKTALSCSKNEMLYLAVVNKNESSKKGGGEGGKTNFYGTRCTLGKE